MIFEIDLDDLLEKVSVNNLLEELKYHCPEDYFIVRTKTLNDKEKMDFFIKNFDKIRMVDLEDIV